MGLPDRCIDHTRIVGVHGQVDGARPVAFVEHLFPGIPAVAGPEDAALIVGSKRVAQGSHVHQVRVLRMDPDPGHVARVRQADVLPGLAAVGGLVYTVAVGDVVADAALAGPYVDHVGVGVGYSHRTDGRSLEVRVGHVPPVGAGVGGLPDAACDRPEEERGRLIRMPGDGDNPAAAEGPDAPPSHDVAQVVGLDAGPQRHRLVGSIHSFVTSFSVLVVDLTGRPCKPCPACGRRQAGTRQRGASHARRAAVGPRSIPSRAALAGPCSSRRRPAGRAS